MQRYDAVLAGVLMVALSVVGVAIAARGEDATFRLFGVALFIFGVLFNFGLIRRYTGSRRAEAE